MPAGSTSKVVLEEEELVRCGGGEATFPTTWASLLEGHQDLVQVANIRRTKGWVLFRASKEVGATFGFTLFGTFPSPPLPTT